MTHSLYDLAVIGGGINGAGIAADAAARGLRVVLLEQNDLGSATSSASSKLIHGGLRYLERGDVRLVRSALQEREVLLAIAPHIIWPLRFVLPHVDGMRHPAMIRAGLFLYDHLARRRQIPASAGVDLRRDAMGKALKPEFARGYSYWDCWADDARLVILNARAAARDGADIQTHSRVISIEAAGDIWGLQVASAAGLRDIRARAVVNAAGPWVDQVSSLTTGRVPSPATADRPKIRLVKGSHIVVPRIAHADDALLMQSPDGRVVFALPFEQAFTLIGTTDGAFNADPSQASIDDQEIGYLLGLAGQFFACPLTRADIVWQFSGVRPLFDDGNPNASAVSRDYRLELPAGEGCPPLLTVLGGKLTTYRRLAQSAVDKLAPFFPALAPCSTALTPLPGGDFGDVGVLGFEAQARQRWPELPAALLTTLIRRYGTATTDVLGDAKTPGDLGTDFGGGLFAREVEYLATHEWAREPADVLWRRTKAGLHMTANERQIAEERLTKLL